MIWHLAKKPSRMDSATAKANKYISASDTADWTLPPSQRLELSMRWAKEGNEMTRDEWIVLAGLLDGVEGFLCEVGYSRYWNMEIVERARQMVAKRKVTKPVLRRGGVSTGRGRATRTPRRR